MRRGEVIAFDEAAGLGTVRTDDGRELFFHCTAVADGSRSIPTGIAVWFRVVAGHRGEYEATELTPA